MQNYFPEWLHHLTLPSSLCEGYNFSISANTSWPSYRWGVVSQCAFDPHFSKRLWCSHCTYEPFISSLEKCLFRFFAHFELDYFSSMVSYMFFTRVDTRLLLQHEFQILFPFCALSFYFLDIVHWNTKMLNLDEVNSPVFLVL
jgi:hypothetical protein